MITVFIASPYGDYKQPEVRRQRVYRQMAVADILIENGICPVVPLYTHFQNDFINRGRELWLAIAKEKLKRCDCLLRLSGDSAGADDEWDFAQEHNIPCFSHVDTLLDAVWRGAIKERSDT